MVSFGTFLLKKEAQYLKQFLGKENISMIFLSIEGKTDFGWVALTCLL